jgi:glutaconate CoA-transferase, subunit B
VTPVRDALSTADQMVWSLARHVRDDDVVVVGVATPIAAAAVLVAREFVAPGLTVIIAASVQPSPHDIAAPMLDAAAVARLSRGTFSQAGILDVIQRGGVTLQFVSPAQVDGAGRLNTSEVRRGDGSVLRLPGGLATGDIAVLIGRLVAYRAEHSPRFLPARVDFATGVGHDHGVDWRTRHGLPGAGVRGVVTDLGVLAWDEAAEGFRLASAHRGVVAQDVASATGFELAVDGCATSEPMPAEARRFLDQVVDPHGIRRLEVRAGRADALAALDALRRDA